MKVWTYVINCDDGGAPNFEPPTTTLAVCKPRIRRGAHKGDFVLAFNGKKLNPREPDSVRWAGVVSEVISLQTYWDHSRFKGKRPQAFEGQRRGGLEDNIYRPTPKGRLEQVENDKHGPDCTQRDVGGVNALVLEPSWYFGSKVAVLPEHYGLRMDSHRRRVDRPPHEIDETTSHKLKKWLDDNVPANPHTRPSEQGGRCGL